MTNIENRISNISRAVALASALLLFAALNVSPARGRQAAATVIDCALQAYVIDPDPLGLNVRSAPGTQAAAIAKLMPNDSGIIVTISGAQGRWVRINRAESVEDETVFDGTG